MYRSEEAHEYRKLYKRARWLKLRKRLLSEQPLCSFCYSKGFVVPATIADHITPHKGNETLFWDYNNLQPLCKTCHDSDKQRMENVKNEIGLDGWPV